MEDVMKKFLGALMISLLTLGSVGATAAMACDCAPCDCGAQCDCSKCAK